MGKFLVRITIIGVAIYFIIAFLVAQICGVNIFSNFYIVFFELITVLYCYSEGKYHCKFIKHTALAIFISDTITRLDAMFNFFSVITINVLAPTIIAIGIGTSLYKAIKHFNRVNKLKKKRNEQQRIIANETYGVGSD